MSGFDVFDVDGVLGHWAIYREPATGPQDDPLYNPLSHLSRIKAHSALKYLQVAFEIDVTINHEAVAASHGWDWSTWSNNWTPEAYTITRVLATHGLGEVPTCLLAAGQGRVAPGFPVQVNGSGGTRYLELECTTTQILLHERVDSGTGSLSALSQTYKLMVLRRPAAIPGADVFLAESGRVAGGEGVFDSDYHYIRAVASGESPYFVHASQAIDTAGGICKFIDALGNATFDFYVSTAYATAGGSLGAITAVQVQR